MHRTQDDLANRGVVTRADAARALAACGRALWERGHASGTSGNLSARVDEATMLCTRSGRAFDALGDDDFALVDIATGRAHDGGGVPTIERPLHLAAYRANPDVRFVVHTHPTYCVVWSCTGRLFPRDTVAATESLAPIAWVPYYPPGSEELAAGVGAAVARDVSLVVLENHGVVAATADLRTAFLQTDLAEQCAMTAYHAAVLRVALASGAS
jgi:L-fuculose-phosphate aldolase